MRYPRDSHPDESLFYMLGEFAQASRGLFDFFEQHQHSMYVLAKGALETLSRLVLEERFDPRTIPPPVGPRWYSPLVKVGHGVEHSVGFSPDAMARGEDLSKPRFSSELSQRLARDERTKWAANLTEAKWDLLLSMLEVLPNRSRGTLRFLEDHAAEVRAQGLSRGSIALEFILMYPLGDEHEARRRMAGES